ncbi:MAG: HAMP domain-containing sensor histidine kinase [Firmicutes bacterium]|jgi:signal transduction histidine kinase|nr:HAMP domain-containing sensor histidine kinase [Bacillota bacterium]MDD4337276.1 HAMP domain-containing sensor histidine kinase [Bacillota bacterium]MDD4792948.1 HAMP domain-containing sensor histidine kinase [Bacillota bacterium]
MTRKDGLPTLRKYFFARFSSGAAIALLIMLIVSLLTADALSSRSAGRALLSDLKEGITHGGPAGMGGGLAGMGAGWRRGRGHGGVQTITPGMFEQYAAAWPDILRVQERGEGYGHGRAPWAGEPVVWAAVRQEDGTVDVSWTRLSAVRAAAGGTYLLVAGAIVLSFAVAAFVTDMGVRRVADAVGSAADASRRMAEGDFRASMDVRDTEELAGLSDAVNHLAVSLDTTLTQLRARNEELARLERLQRQFVADASHELRAPLTSMSIILDAASDGLMTDEEKDEAWPILRAEVRRLSRTVSELLDLSRIESGREPINMEIIDVGRVVEEVHRWYQSLPGKLPAMEVSIESSPDHPLEAFADSDALHRCLVNFVDNAIKATPSTGRISMWAGRCGDDWVEVSVSDTGGGMTREELARVWERFARSERSRSSGREGSGLGLSIVHALADAMGGQVGLESELGSGTRARIRLKSSREESKDQQRI